MNSNLNLHVCTPLLHVHVTRCNSIVYTHYDMHMYIHVQCTCIHIKHSECHDRVRVMSHLTVLLSTSRDESISLWWKKELKTCTLFLSSGLSVPYHRYLYPDQGGMECGHSPQTCTVCVQEEMYMCTCTMVGSSE